MPHRKLKVSARGMLDAYENLLTTRGYVADGAQMAAAGALQALYGNLLSFKVNRGSTFKRLLATRRGRARQEFPDGLLL